MSQQDPTQFLKLPKQALNKLKKSEPRMAILIDCVGPFAMPAPRQMDHLEALCRAIVYQQLSGKAAATIFGRFRALFPAASFPTAQQIQALDDATLRGCGLSGQKVSYLRDLCRQFLEKPDLLAGVDHLDDELIVGRLTQVRGLGRWSAEMFLMFHLGRLDVWPQADLGIRKGVQRLHGLADLPTLKQMPALGAPYAPYRSVAAWYLWRLLELPNDTFAEAVS